jgi:hypothetical protein
LGFRLRASAINAEAAVARAIEDLEITDELERRAGCSREKPSE